MKFYSVFVHLGGDILNQVLKPDVSAPEVLLLNELHGGDGVAKCDYVREAEVNHRALRASLESRYGQKEAQLELIQRLFGPASVRLPESVDLADLRAPVETPAEEPIEIENDVPTAVKEPVEKSPEDPREAIRASIKALGGSVPNGNLSEARLRDILTTLQRDKLGIPDVDAPGPASVM